MTTVEIYEVAQRLHVVASEAEARELLATLDARTLRLVGRAYESLMAQAYDNQRVVLRAKAGKDELVKRLIHVTVGMRLWVAAYKRQQA